MKKTAAATLILCLILVMTCVISAVNAVPAVKGESSHSEKTLYNGVQHAEIKTSSDAATYNAQHINVVEFDLKQTDLYLETAYYNDTAHVNYSGSQVSNIMKQYNEKNPDKKAIAGINGDMWLMNWVFNSTGRFTAADKAKKDITISRSFNLADGEIYTSEISRKEKDIETGKSTPDASTWTFCVTDDYIPAIGQPYTVITLKDTTLNKTAKVDGINRYPVNDVLFIYTDKLMGAYRDFTQDDSYELLVEFDSDYKLCHGADVTGTVKAIYDENTSSNPPLLSNKQMVITARGNRITDIKSYKVGDKINVTVEIHDYQGEDGIWQRARYAVSGSVPIANNGVIRPEVDLAASTGYPSTIIGYNRDGKIVFVTMDGRGVGGAGGSRSRYKQLVADLDLYEALLLDGGGSMTMTVATDETYTAYKTVSTPSDGADRTIDNAVILAFGPKRAEQGQFTVEDPYNNTDPQNVTFPSSAYVKAFIEYANQTEASAEDGALKLSVKDSEGKTFDPYVIFNFGNLANKGSADENKFVTLVYKMPTTNSRASGKVKYYGTEVCRNYYDSNPKQFTYMTDKYEYVVFDMSGASDWTGDITKLRLDYLFASGEDGDTMYVHNIIFSGSASEAKAAAESIVEALNKAPEADPEETDPSGEPVFESDAEPDETADDPETDPEVIDPEETEPYIDVPEDKGDCNGDGEVNNKDVVILFRYVSSGAEHNATYDFSGDGEVNNKDVVALFRHVSAARQKLRV